MKLSNMKTPTATWKDLPEVRMALLLALTSLACTVQAGESDFFQPGSFFIGCNYWGSQHGIRMWRADLWNAEEVEKVCESIDGYVVPVNYNSAVQTVIAGDSEPCEKAAAEFAALKSLAEVFKFRSHNR